MTIKAVVFDAYGTLYDVHSVTAATAAAFPGHGETISVIWRLKQLEYSWLRCLMGRYEDFRTVTLESLRYTLDTIGLPASPAVLEAIVDAYNKLTPYPDAAEALKALAGCSRIVLSNGSPDMLDALVRHSGFGSDLDVVISADAAQAYKPDPRVYALVPQRLGVAPDEVMFVTGNGFDTAGAASFGFRVARIERLTAAALRQELGAGPAIGPSQMFKALRMRTEALEFQPHAVVASLRELPGLIAKIGA